MQLLFLFRYLVRLGIGEKDQSTGKNFSRLGRVNYMLERRLLLLTEVKKLSNSLNVHAYDEFSCETADIFFTYHVLSRWNEYRNRVLKPFLEGTIEKNQTNIKKIGAEFPFLGYLGQSCFYKDEFGNGNGHPDMVNESNGESLVKRFFTGESFETEYEKVKFYFQVVNSIFRELKECRAFEVLRDNRERGNYIVSQQAKIIAMTCTHAALKRQDLLDMGFEYDNLIVEESAQILEIESFIPMQLQKPSFSQESRIKRTVMIGKGCSGECFVY